jgi:rhamnosyltransferase
MPLVPYKIVGPFREDFFIDGVDQEYCLRLRHYGYKVILAHNAIMTHSLGSPIIKTFLGKVFIPTNHSSLRYYYFIRNGIYIARIYFFSESRWVTRHLFAQFKLVFKIILFEHEKVEKLKMVFLGFCHALSGKLGSLQVR